MLDRVLGHPAARGLDLDSPELTALRREIVKTKPFLRTVYEEWYRLIVDSIPSGDGEVLELGAGGGFLKDLLPDVITSDLFDVPGVDSVVNALHLPFDEKTLKAILMTNVFHHIPDVAGFISEAERALRPGGCIVMIEPWNTPWSRFVHRRFHHEPMLTDVEEWTFPTTGPLSGANAALPWIVVDRDQDRLKREWPALTVTKIRPLMPFRYLVSGGVSLRSLQPGWAYPFWKAIDESSLVNPRMAVFALIVLERHLAAEVWPSAADAAQTDE